MGETEARAHIEVPDLLTGPGHFLLPHQPLALTPSLIIRQANLEINLAKRIWAAGESVWRQQRKSSHRCRCQNH